MNPADEHRPLLVYIAGALSDPDSEKVKENIAAAISHSAGLHAYSNSKFIAICPHAMTERIHKEHPMPEEFWQKGMIALMKACDLVYVLPGWEDSDGTKKEVIKAWESSKQIISADVEEGRKILEYIDGFLGRGCMCTLARLTI